MSGTWSDVKNLGPFDPSKQSSAEQYLPDAMLLLTDGSVLVHDDGAQFGGGAWYRLFPSNTGDYSAGTWNGPYKMNYQRESFGSGVLPDGRVFVVGGEQTNDPNSYTPNGYSMTGEIFDPITNAWSMIASKPAVKSSPVAFVCGDTPCCVLADGRVLFGGTVGSALTAIYDPVADTWVQAGKGKGCNGAFSLAYWSDEETWTLLPDGSVLTIVVKDTSKTALRYMPSLDAWVSAGKTLTELQSGYEIGPAILMPDGTVFCIGALGATAIYSLPANPTDPCQTGSWTSGPSFPNNQSCIDGPAVLLPSGNVLCVAGTTSGVPYSANYWSNNPTFYEYVPGSPGSFVATAQQPNAADTSGCMFLLLPTGQVLFVGDGLVPLKLYSPTGSPKAEWAPTITSCPARITLGIPFTIKGTKFNGLSQAVGYGDDYSAATNYPIVRVKFDTNHVGYLKTSGFTLGVATGNSIVQTTALIPKENGQILPGVITKTEQISADLVVIANGIASKPVAVTIVVPAS